MSNDQLPPNDCRIVQFFQCSLCLAELPPDQSPRDFQRIEVGWTVLGFQVWCKRHDCNVIHMSFEGQQHPANTFRKRFD